MKKLLLLSVLTLSCCLMAQTPLNKPSGGEVTQISPYYFGPNAFPVPEMLDGRVQSKLRLEMAADYYHGYRGDHTEDIFLKLNIPLWTDRANLTVWMPLMEWYRNSDANIQTCRIQPPYQEEARKGSLMGDVNLSIDMQVLRERRYRPDWVLRAALKTASGGDFHLARYYDSPGYFFDTSVAKSFRVGKNPKWNHRLRTALSTGFLCWQTDNGRQNDAVQFGVMAKYENSFFTLSETFAGYCGWEGSIQDIGSTAHDRPMVLRTDIVGHIRRFDIVAAYQYGLQDYPYHQFRLGVAYKWDILKKMLKKEK